MVPRLPVFVGARCNVPLHVKLLKKAGFRAVRQRGSHVSLRKENHKTVVPLHYELAKGTLLGILKQCGLSRDDLKKLLEKT